MEFVRNKKGTSVTIKRYVGYDKAKRHSVVAAVGTIRLVPRVPTSVPATIAAKLTSEEQVEARATLEQIREDHECAALKNAVSMASAGMDTVTQAIAGGRHLDPDQTDGLRTTMQALMRVLDIPSSSPPPSSPPPSPPPPSPPVPGGDPAVAALAALNALVDAIHGGLNVPSDQAMELTMQLDMITELASAQLAPGTGAKDVPTHRPPDGLATILIHGDPAPV